MEFKHCKECGTELSTIVWVHMMSEEWTYNGWQWECCYHDSLVNDPHLPVFCPECNAEIGTGKDFGF